MPTKPKTNQPATPKEVQLRDCFSTPDYATDLIVPYLRPHWRVWEPAAGEGRMARRLREFMPMGAIATSIEGGCDFLDTEPPPEADVIVTNPPFSLKKQFVERCLAIRKPWALLLPVDMCQWNLEAVEKNWCQWLVPKRRIDYITPNMLQLIREGEVWKLHRPTSEIAKGMSLAQYKKASPGAWESALTFNPGVGVYASIDDVPPPVLNEYSSSQFHSGWLTWGLDLPSRLTIVDLPDSAKKAGVLIKK